MWSYIKRKFPAYGLPNIRLYYLLSILGNLWFIVGTWLFAITEHISVADYTIVESLAVLVSLLMEIPSGALADLLGKKKMVLISYGMQVVGLTMFFSGQLGAWVLILGSFIHMLAFSFLSGSLEALAYDSLVETGKEEHYETVASRANMLFMLTLVGSAALGGLLWKLGPLWPAWANIIGFGLAFVAALYLTEPSVDTYTFSWPRYLAQNKEAFKQLHSGPITRYAPLFVGILSLYSLWSAGIVRLSMAEGFGMDGETASYLISITVLVAALITYRFEAIKQWLGNERGLMLFAGLMAGAYILTGLSANPVLGVTLFFVITIVGRLTRPWLSIVINASVDSKYRATAISAFELLTGLPYVVTIVVFGWVTARGMDNWFYVTLGGMLLAVMAWHVWRERATAKL